VPFPSTDAQLDTLLEEIPVLAGRPRQLEELSGGLTNRNVKVTTPDAVYVARCTDTSCNFLAIDRDDEYHNSVAAERAGVGAPVIEYRPDLGILLLGFLNGRHCATPTFSGRAWWRRWPLDAEGCTPGPAFAAGSTCSNASPNT
jgi:hypothetical protein